MFRQVDKLTLHSPVLAATYRYWNAQRGERRMPARDDLDPGDMRAFLPHLLMLDVERNPLRYRYRLIGTRITNAAGHDATGRYVDDVISRDQLPGIKAAYDKVVEHACPIGRQGLAHWIKGREWMPIEALLLPIGREQVDIIMVSVSTEPPAGVRQIIDADHIAFSLNLELADNAE